MARIDQLPHSLRRPVRFLRELFRWPYKALKRFYKRYTFKYVERGMATDYLTSFIHDKKFIRAYNRGVSSMGQDLGLYFRIHQATWAVESVRDIDGDLIELGVGTGFTMSSVLEYIDWWETSTKYLWLVDTFLPYEVDKDIGLQLASGSKIATYATFLDDTKKNFSYFPRVKFVQGIVPNCLENLRTEAISFIHVDLNHAAPEVEGIKRLWPNVTKGAIILLDDYGFPNRINQHNAMNALSAELDFSILTLPTGQGLAIKK